MAVGILNLHFSLVNCKSLKEKRGIILPLIHRLQMEFCFSVAEMAHQDSLAETVISCAAISNDLKVIQSLFSRAVNFSELHFHDLILLEQTTEYC